ncbi:cytochrome D1 domain-containing protein [Candidatus Rariloculus sp.]|uniref:cytochrome D1 domain-containing protein n=1 Tax=Candidatus Rariloculus sp. TaxID=3101265 RepID=UPI003D0DCAD5
MTRSLWMALLLYVCCSSVSALDGTLIVANRSGGSISLIDLAAGVEIARVPIGPIIPHEVAVSPDGTKALAGEYGPEDDHGRHIVLIDVASASVEARIDLGPGSRPHSVLFLPDGRHAVATMQESDQLALVDLDTRSVVRTYPTGGRDGHMVRLSPDGSRAYVTSRGAEGTLSVIFLDQERAPVVIETGLGAEGLDVTADGGEIWVANRREETISVIDAESLEVVATLDSRPFSGRIEMGRDGYAIVPNGGGLQSPVPRFVRLWDVGSRTLVGEMPLPGEPYEGNFGALIHDGTAFVADPGEGLIQIYDLDGGLSNRRVLIDNHDAPDGMAWTPVRVNAMALAGLTGAQVASGRSSAEPPPDLTGIWNQDRGNWSIEDLPFTPEGREKQASKRAPDAVEACTVHYFGQTITGPLPVEILQRQNRATFLYELQHEVRRIFMDGRGHPEPLYPSVMGHSIGRWEGATLVVETAGLREGWFRPEGVPYTEQARVVERYTLNPAGDEIMVELVLSDPVYYTEPIEVTRRLTLMPDGEILEYGCAVSEYLYE